VAEPVPALLFDLDGTLVDSVYQHVLAWHEVLAKAGMELSVWRIHRRIGMSGGLFVNALLRETGKKLSAEEAKRLLAAKLPLPGYEMILKAAHTFNLLDARGAISVTERAGYIGRIRTLSRLVAQAYVESREALGFPMLAAQVKAA